MAYDLPTPLPHCPRVLWMHPSLFSPSYSLLIRLREKDLLLIFSVAVLKGSSDKRQYDKKQHDKRQYDKRQQDKRQHDKKQHAKRQQ